VGSASPRIVSALAERHPGTVPSDLDELRAFYTFRDFAHFIEVYLAVVDLVRDAEDVRMLTYEVAADLAAQRVRYAELTLTPYTNVRAGVPIEAFVEAVEDARVAAERDHDVVLGGPEVGVPRPQFRPYFEQARAAGLRSVPHAGETTGPETVWDALRELGAERIGHGTSITQDPELLAHVVEHRIPLEVCPTSNLATRAVARLEEHPVREMYAAGAVVTINSDDPPMFGTTLTREYQLAAELLQLDEAGIAELARTAVRSSFLDQSGKDGLLEEIDEYAGSRQATPGPSVTP
jgi:aminodeoxyfutalosine deaminase